MLNRPDIVGLTGGGDTKLDGIATTGLSVGTIVLVYDESSGETRIYRLSDTSGVVSDSIPIVIVPDDYNATTNHKVWKLSMSSDADETGSSDTISPGSGDTTDTIVVAAQLKVYGELIADSIQSAGDTLYIDKPFHSVGFNNVGTATITGLATVNGGINITAGGLDIDAGGINVDAGGLNINAGGASITGAVNVTGSETISNALYVDTIDVESYDSVVVNDDLKVVGDLLVTGSITGSYLGAMDTVWANFSAGKSHTTDTVVTYDNLKVYGELIADSIQSAGDTLYIDKPFHSIGFNNVGTANITGNTDIGGDLDVNGDFSANEGTFNGNLTANSGNITNDLTVGGNLTVTGDISGNNGSFGSDLNVTGDLSADSIHAGDDVVVSNNLDVGGTGHFVGNVTIEGDLTVNGDLVNGNIEIDTLYRGNKATVTDTIVAYDNFKVHGELIADSIQAVGDTLEIDDTVVVHGGLIVDEIPDDNTFDSLLTVVEGMVSKVPTSDLVAAKTRFSHVLWVDGENGDDATADGSISKPYKTIQAAINAVSTDADSFYTIMITPGSYNEALTINNKNITLQSAAGEFDGVGISGGSSPAVTFTSDADKWYYFEAHGIVFSSSGHRCLDFTNIGAAMIHECSANCGHRSDTAIYIDNSSYNWASYSYVTIQDVYTNKGGIYSEDLHSLFVLYSDIAGRIYAKSSSSSNKTGLILRHSTIKTASMRNPSNVKDSCLVLDGNVIADVINSNLYSGKIVVNGNSEISKFTGSVADRRIELNGTSKLTCYGSYIDTLVDNTSGDITLYSTNFDHLIVSDNTGAFDVRTSEIMVGDTITEHKYYGTDATGADSFWIYDDGDTTRFDSDNPIKVGHSSLIVDVDGYVTISDGLIVGSDTVIVSGGDISTDTVFSGKKNTVTDTVVAYDNFKVYGELIADSIQAVGDTLEIDDTVIVHGGLIVDQVGDDNTHDSVLTIDNGMLKKVASSELIGNEVAIDHIFWVSTNGNDATADGSASNPFRTVKAACDSAGKTAGNVAILIAPGEYHESGIDLPYGTFLVGMGENMQSVIIGRPSGSYVTDTYVFRVVDPTTTTGKRRTVSFEGIKIDGTKLNNNSANDVATVTFSGLTSNTQGPIYFTNCDIHPPERNQGSGNSYGLDIGQHAKAIYVEHCGLYEGSHSGGPTALVYVHDGGWVEIRDNTWFFAPFANPTAGYYPTAAIYVTGSSSFLCMMDAWGGTYDADEDCDLVRVDGGAVYMRGCHLQYGTDPATSNRAAFRAAAGVGFSKSGLSGIFNCVFEGPSNGYDIHISGSGEMSFAQNSYDPNRSYFGSRTISSSSYMPTQENSHVVFVSKGVPVANKVFSKLSDALAYVKSQHPSSSNRWTIIVRPGHYPESGTGAMIVPSWTNIVGSGKQATTIALNRDLHIGGDLVEIRNLTISHTGTPYDVVVDDTANNVMFEDVDFYNGTEVKAYSSSITENKSIVFKQCLFNMQTGGRGLTITGNSSHTVSAAVINCNFAPMSTPSANVYGIYADYTILGIQECAFNMISVAAVYINHGYLKADDCYFQNFAGNAISMQNSEYKIDDCVFAGIDGTTGEIAIDMESSWGEINGCSFNNVMRGVVIDDNCHAVIEGNNFEMFDDGDASVSGIQLIGLSTSSELIINGNTFHRLVANSSGMLAAIYLSSVPKKLLVNGNDIDSVWNEGTGSGFGIFFDYNVTTAPTGCSDWVISNNKMMNISNDGIKFRTGATNAYLPDITIQISGNDIDAGDDAIDLNHHSSSGSNGIGSYSAIISHNRLKANYGTGYAVDVAGNTTPKISVTHNLFLDAPGGSPSISRYVNYTGTVSAAQNSNVDASYTD